MFRRYDEACAFFGGQGTGRHIRVRRCRSCWLRRRLRLRACARSPASGRTAGWGARIGCLRGRERGVERRGRLKS
eukprot:3941544-Pleurochrysis_carterae.AAC.1